MALPKPVAQKPKLNLQVAAVQRVLFGHVLLQIGTSLEHSVAQYACLCHGIYFLHAPQKEKDCVFVMAAGKAHLHA